MSVLNQMLRELEHRGALPAVVAAAGTATVARPTLPAAARSADPLRRWVWAGVLAGAAALFGAYSWLDHRLGQAGAAPQPLGSRQFGTVANSPAAESPAADAVASAAPALSAPAIGAAQGAAAVAPGREQDAAAAGATRGPSPEAAGAMGRTARAAAKPPHATSAATAAPAATTAAARVSSASAAGRRPAAAAPAPPFAGSAPASAGHDVHPTPMIVARAADDVARELERANERIARGRSSEAIELLQTALARQPAHAVARRTLAALLAETGRRDEALGVLLAGAQADPARFAPAAAQLQAERGDVHGALSTLARLPAAQRTPAHEALAGGLLQRTGDHPAAIAAYRRALAQPRPEPVWWVGLGVSLEASGELAQAHAAFGNAAADAQLPAEVRQYVQERLAALSAQSARAEQARRASLANVF